MENFRYHLPFYVVTGGIDQAGHSSELGKGQVGLFDRNTFSVATSVGNGKEFFFAQGVLGGKDWYGFPVEGSHKSPFFYGEDVKNMWLSLPKERINEEWVIGFNGSPSSKGLRFEEGKAVRVKLYFFGQPTYRFFGGPKEYVVSYTPQKPCDEPCNENDCPDPITDCLTHTQKLIDEINDHVELRKFGVKAKIVVDPFTAATPNMEKFQLCLCDNGSALDLHAVQNQYPDKTITRISRSGSTSCYEFCQRDTLDAPVDFEQTGSVLYAVCGDCPTGSTLTAAKDVYEIRRPLAGDEDLTTDAARDTYADTIGTAYGVATDGDKTFVGQDGGVAIVKIKVAEGTTINALLADTVEFSHNEAAVCTFDAPADIAWASSGVGIASRRKLRINALNRPDCDANGDRIDDLTAILSGVEGIDIATLTKIAGIACADDYTVEQDSVDCLPEDCLTNNVTFSYTDLPAFEGSSWEVVPPVVTENANRKCGIRITAGYIDPDNFSDCTFQLDDYYETEPLKMEVSLLQETGDNCDYATLPSQHQSVFGQISRQTGEYVIRQVVMKTDAYLKHMRQYSANPREREAFDKNLLGSVDRNAFYKLYYVSFDASYGKSFRKNEQEKFTAVFAFKEDDPSAQVFETTVLDVLTAKSGVKLHVND